MGFLPGLRWRKTISILPGVKINLSKSGVSTSLGGHGATVNVGTGGRRTITLGIPGTGLSYRVPLAGTIVILLLAVVVIIGLAYLIAPDQVRALLHWWQPKIF
ncbi:MAG: DUF4236 domain-containing protein [Hyphomicrobiaceae bacterium]|nr:MAG: DUF4236 domain-containing protein [Hyphomicrobiaceae bacterium]